MGMLHSSDMDFFIWMFSTFLFIMHNLFVLVSSLIINKENRRSMEKQKT